MTVSDAIIEDHFGYIFGRRDGSRSFKRENSFLFPKKTLSMSRLFISARLQVDPFSAHAGKKRGYAGDASKLRGNKFILFISDVLWCEACRTRYHASNRHSDC